MVEESETGVWGTGGEAEAGQGGGDDCVSCGVETTENVSDFEE